MRRTDTGIILPGLSGRSPTMVCRVPTGPEEVCGKPFYEGEERRWREHMAACISQHAQQIHEESPKTRQPAIHDHPDPEVEAHMEQVGKRMLQEGRLVVKPSERAGF